MCFQGFAHCSCGHVRLLEITCELAADIPFYIKVACPKYQYSSIKPNRACGIGKFYCRETREGQFLEQVYQMFETTATELSQINARSKSFDAILAKFNQSADAAGVSQEARKRHSAYHRICGRLEALHQQRDQVTVERMAIMSIIQERYNYYLRRAEAARSGLVGASRPFILSRELRSILPIEMQAQLDALAAPDISFRSSMTEQVIDMSDVKQHQRSQIRQATSDGENIYVTPRNRGYPAQNVQEGTTMLQTPDFAARLPILQQRNRPKRVVEQDRGRASADTAERRDGLANTPSLLIESPNVRRSARIRDKKVTYAESEASPIHSRDASPEKSDGDNFMPTNSDRDDFSPSKSDLSPSPERVTQRRRRSPNLRKEMSDRTWSTLGGNAGSLSALMNDWKRRNTAAPTFLPGQQQMPLVVGEDNYLATGASTNNPASTGVRTEVASTPLPQMLGGSRITAYEARTGATPPQGWRPLPRQDPSAPAVPITGMNNTTNVQPMSSMRYWQNTRTPGLPHKHADIPTEPETPNAIYQPSQTQPMPNQTNSPGPWLINTPPYYIAELAASQGQGHLHPATDAPMERHDSAIGAHANSAFAGPTFSSVNYDRLRRSFSATADLTPPARNNLELTNTDPKKRSLPASSPLLPSSKRIRLSLPGEDVVGMKGDVFPHGVTGSMSSPSKMATQQLSGNYNIKQSAATEELSVTPAPILAPTAVMYMPQKEQQVGEEDVVESEVYFVEDTSNKADVEDGRETQFSDIDWSLINDDIL